MEFPTEKISLQDVSSLGSHFRIINAFLMVPKKIEPKKLCKQKKVLLVLFPSFNVKINFLKFKYFKKNYFKTLN